MSETHALRRCLELIALLKRGRPQKIEFLARHFQVDKRTIERNIRLLKDIGLNVVNKKGFGYCIPGTEGEDLNPENLIAFTLEEADIIRKALEVSDGSASFVKEILKKIYVFSEQQDIEETLRLGAHARHVRILRQAISGNLRVIMHQYRSGNSQTISDRVVEPISLDRNFQKLYACDVLTGINKWFKIDRASDIELTKEYCTMINHKNHETDTDAFGFSGTEKIRITFQMSLLAFNLLREEFPETVPYLTRIRSSQYIFDGWVRDFKGVGRFVLGLPGEIHVEQPSGFVAYLKDELNRNTF